MTEKEIAQALLPLVGGKENIVSVMHCATRLRIVVTDKEKIQVKEVENLDKVKGSFFNAGQYQIIFGTGLVNRVYEAVMKELGLQPEAAIDDKPAKPVTGNRFQRPSACSPTCSCPSFRCWWPPVCSWACGGCSRRTRCWAFLV